jgi:hypothetical protein
LLLTFPAAYATFAGLFPLLVLALIVFALWQDWPPLTVAEVRHTVEERS